MRNSSSAGYPVKLNVYDLGPHNEYLHEWGLGTYHSGVEISGKEYTFASGSGVFDHEPKSVPGHAKHRETILLGTFHGTTNDYERIISSLKDEYHGQAYNLLTKNCNHFANSLILKLLNKPIPSYVNRLASLGGMFSCLFPPQLLTDAPVDQQNNNNQNRSSSNNGYQVIRPKNRESVMTTSEPTTSSSSSSLLSSTNTSTTNSGFILGGGSGGEANENNSSQLGIHERREKARLAALKRMSKQEN